MPQDPFRATIDGIRSRVQAELEAQLTAIADQHAEALAEAQRTAELEAEQRWAAKVETVRAEWTARLDSEVAAARGEAERRIIAEATRVRMEAEQAAAESTARMREELEQALAVERQRGQAQVEAERERTEREIERQREALRAEAQAQGQQSAAVVEAHASERQAQLATLDRLLLAVRAIGAAQSLSETLTALVTAAAAEAPRAALFVANGDHLQGFKDAGFSGIPPSSLSIPVNDPGVLGEAFRRGAAVPTSGESAPAAPRFASLAAERAGLAVPIVVGDRTVAVLYTDDGGESTPEVPAAWPESVQILGRHASACLAHLTAVRTAQATRMSAAMSGASGIQLPGGAAPAADSTPEDENGARRYARLLVSEIKLYNEPAIQAGRQNRDLLRRLRPEIERARRLYEERVPPAVAAGGTYFHQELVQTLADGDPTLLGG
jgi:chemotaxis protein histidine kinase CheA